MNVPVAFSDPVWLWLALPAVAIVVVGWMAASRTLPAGRRIASLVIRLTLVACLVLALAGHAARAPVRPSQRRLPARRVRLDARRDARGPRGLGARQRARDAGRRHGRGRRVRRQRAGRPPPLRARRALGPGLGARGRRDERRGRGAVGRGHLPERHAAANRAPVRRQRHLGRGGGRHRGGLGAWHPARRRHAGRRVGGRGAGRRGRCAAGARVGETIDLVVAPALDHHHQRHAAAAGRWRHRRHARAGARAGRDHDPVRGDGR